MNIESDSKQTVKQSIIKQNTAKQRITKRLLAISMASLMFVSIPTIYANAEEPSTSYQPTEPIITTTSYTTTWLRVRAEPSFNGEVIDCLEPATSVQVIETMSNGWTAVWYDGSLRFMYSDYLTTGEDGVQQEDYITQNIEIDGVQQENAIFGENFSSDTFEESAVPSQVFDIDFDSESQNFDNETDFLETIEDNNNHDIKDEDDFTSIYDNEIYSESTDFDTNHEYFCDDEESDSIAIWYADEDDENDEGYVYIEPEYNDEDTFENKEVNEWYDIDGVNTYFDKAYSAEDFKQLGIITYNGLTYTYYSEQVLPGGGLDIPNRHINSDGYVVDGEGYIVLASPDLDNYTRYSTIITPFGYGKFYDHCPEGNFDVYVAW